MNSLPMKGGRKVFERCTLRSVGKKERMHLTEGGKEDSYSVEFLKSGRRSEAGREVCRGRDGDMGDRVRVWPDGERDAIGVGR